MSPLRFHPVTQLMELLGPKPNHPWGVLLPQILLWSFRRFCVEKLTYEGTVPLSEQLWEDHFDLIHRYAPKGLDTVAMEWFTPENIERVWSSLEDYNRFFIDCVVAIDESLEKDDEELQDELSVFLDVTIIHVIQNWLGGDFQEFFLFPTREEDDDEFRDSQLLALIQALVAFSQTPAAAAPAPEPVPEPIVPLSQDPTQPPPPHPIEYPPEPVEYLLYPENYTPPLPPPLESPRDPIQPPPSLFTEALATRRRTLCNRPRERSTRGKTRRIPPRA